MKYLGESIGKHIDFHFVVAIIAILGTAGALYLQFNEADAEFYTLNASMYSAVRNQKTMDDRESAVLDYQLDQLGNELDALILK